jgi:hypothetical protein
MNYGVGVALIVTVNDQWQ